MKGMGPKEERETIINFNELSTEIDLWTASEEVYRLFMNRGYPPYEDGERHAAFKLPEKALGLLTYFSSKKQKEAIPTHD